MTDDSLPRYDAAMGPVTRPLLQRLLDGLRRPARSETLAVTVPVIDPATFDPEIVWLPEAADEQVLPIPARERGAKARDADPTG